MKTKLQFLIPNKKTAIIFTALSIVMGLAVLHLDSFYPFPKFTSLYSVLWPATEPAWKFWMYFSSPVLVLTDGVIPQESIRWFNLQSWELTFGTNLVYYYFIAATVSSFWTRLGERGKIIQ